MNSEYILELMIRPSCELTVRDEGGKEKIRNYLL